MRQKADQQRIRELMSRLGEAARTPSRVYLVGGATAVLQGWRPSTIDVDLTFDPESREIYEAIPRLKVQLDLNIEFASPAHFVPELPGWRDRCLYVGTWGKLTVLHYDPYGQALAKIERSHEQDRADVRHLIDSGLVEPQRLRDLFEQAAPDLVKYPAVDPETLRARLREVK
ncbi:MAG: DUF6036 family nucleotidyltransferase [Myxococcota bacterium]